MSGGESESQSYFEKSLSYFSEIYVDAERQGYDEFDPTLIDEVIGKFPQLDLDKEPGLMGKNFVKIPYLDPEKKLKLNRLTEKTRKQLLSYNLYYEDVDAYFKERIKRDRNEEFVESVKAAFRAAYNRIIVTRHIYGDDLFDALLPEIAGGMEDLKSKRFQVTAAAVIVYLFLKCDLFAKTEEELRRDLANQIPTV